MQKESRSIDYGAAVKSKRQKQQTTKKIGKNLVQ